MANSGFPKQTTQIYCSLLIAVFLSLLAVAGPSSAADDDGDTMTPSAKIAQKIQSKLHPLIQIPISYNYNQNRQANQNFTQAQIQVDPIIPVLKDENHGFILAPMFLDNITAQNQQTTNQATPLQLATYFATSSGNFLYGIGPFIQMPTANNASGSQQTGLGVSYGFFYEPKHLVIGGTAYNAWGAGQNRTSGTANVYYYNPVIAYITDDAWTYSIQSWINGNPTNGQSNNNNQMILSFGKTHKMPRTHIQWQIGPTYMVTPTASTPRGWGGYFSLTFAFVEKGY